MTKALVLLAIAMLLSGCVNCFTQFYRDYTVNYPPARLERLLPYSGTTQVYSSNNLPGDCADMVRRGYMLLGESAFEAGGNVSKEQMIEQAKRVGADVVICSSKFDRTEQAYVPVVQYQPGQTATTFSSGTSTANVYGNNGMSAFGSGQYSGYSTTTSPGTFSTTEVPVTVRRYDYDAAFWRKASRPILGVSAVNLPDDLRTTLKRNTGALIKIVMNDSPAFRANVIPGDILIKIDETPIYSATELSSTLLSFAGKDCVLTILRDGKEIQISVKMNPLQ